MNEIKTDSRYIDEIIQKFSLTKIKKENGHEVFLRDEMIEMSIHHEKIIFHPKMFGEKLLAELLSLGTENGTRIIHQAILQIIGEVLPKYEVQYMNDNKLICWEVRA